MTLGERISRCRKDLGISQEELGGRLGVSRQAVSKWETGKAVPDMENLLALSKIFGVPVSELTETPVEKLEAPPPEPPPVHPKPISLRFWAGLGILSLTVLALLATGLFLREPQYHDDHVKLERRNSGHTLDQLDNEPSFLSDAEIVYRAFNALASDNLTAEERYAYRRDLFTGLNSMDWAEFGRLGATNEESDCIFALMNFLYSVADYSESEIYCLQRAAANPGIDGAYAEFYSGVLSRALYLYPVVFVQELAYDDSSCEPWPYHAMSLAAFDLSYFPEKTERVADLLETALSDGSFTEEQSGWCRLLLLYLEAEDGDQSGLPQNPEALSEWEGD